LRRFFTPVEGGYQIGKAVRELCMFARHDVTRDPPFSRLDLISCRNLLIYFAPSLQNKVMPIFHYALNPHGFLMLGSSEGIGNVTDLFAIADKKYRIYSRKARSHRIIFNFDRSSYVDDLMVADVTVDKVVVNESVDLVNSREAVAEINTELNIEQIADRVVLHRYAPVGVLVSDDLDIVQFRGDTSRYLAHFSGKPSLNVLKMAHPKLLAALRSTIHEAKQHNIPICTEGVAMSQDVRINIDVIPLQDNCDRYFLVLFASNSPSAAIPIISLAPTKSRKVRQIEAELAVIRLTHELENSKEHLRSVIKKSSPPMRN
jgi:two-component system CheB/CheR fusion protein